MLITAIGFDSPQAPALRPTLLDPHVAHVRKIGFQLRLAAPLALRDHASLDGAMDASIIIVEGNDPQALVAMLASDPYAEHGVWGSIFYGVVRHKGNRQPLLMLSGETRHYIALRSSADDQSAGAVSRATPISASALTILSAPLHQAAESSTMDGAISHLEIISAPNLEEASAHLARAGASCPAEWMLYRMPVAMGTWTTANSSSTARAK